MYIYIYTYLLYINIYIYIYILYYIILFIYIYNIWQRLKTKLSGIQNFMKTFSYIFQPDIITDVTSCIQYVVFLLRNVHIRGI